MRRVGAWILLSLALVAMQVPWVECLADCHDVVHPDRGPGRCLSADAVHGPNAHTESPGSHAKHSGAHAQARGDNAADGHAHDGLAPADRQSGLDHESQHVKRGFEFVSVHPDVGPDALIAAMDATRVSWATRCFAGDAIPAAAVPADRPGLRSTVLRL